MEDFIIKKSGDLVIVRYVFSDNIIDEKQFTIAEILRLDDYNSISEIVDNLIFKNDTISKIDECNEHLSFVTISKLKLIKFIQVLKDNPKMIENDMDYLVSDTSNILNCSDDYGFVTYNNPDNTISNSFITTNCKGLDLFSEKKIVLNNTTDYYDIELPRFEYQYVHSLKKLLEKGIECQNRTGINTRVIQHQYFYFKNITDNFPILRGKKLYPKMALKECLWMLKGRNDLKWLNDRKVSYWNEWSIEDLKTAERFNLDTEWIGTIGKSYGYQYRNFNGFDQVEALVKNMYKDPMGRRHIINLWNSADLHQMALPPCMYDFHFECTPVYAINPNNSNQISHYLVDLHAHVRSNDSFLGAPYDFMFCGWMLTMICNYLNHYGLGSEESKKFKPNDVHYTADNYHLYVNHIDAAKQYITNVEENKDGVIDIPSIIEPCFLDDFFLHLDKPYTIDEYLDMIDNNMSNIKINQCCMKPIFEYGPIKADIAI